MNKEELKAKIESLQNDIEIMNDTISKTKALKDDRTSELYVLFKELEKLENKEEVYVPKKGELYYTIDVWGVIDYYWQEDDTDNYLYENGLVFKSKEEAQRAEFERNLHSRMKKFSMDNGSCEIDWDDYDDPKYYIYFPNSGADDIRIDSCYTTQVPNIVYFHTSEVAKKAIEIFKDDLLKYFLEE